MEHEPTSSDDEWQRAQAARAAFPWFGTEPSTTGEPGAAAEAAPIPSEGTPLVLAPAKIDTAAPKASAATREPVRSYGDIASDTSGELVPRYQLIPYRADRLAAGDLMLEPHLGEVRIVRVGRAIPDPARQIDLLQVHWTDDSGSNQARALPADEPVTLRIPDRQDQAAIRQALDQSWYHRRQLDHRGARLIAAHLQAGPASPLYRLAVTGEIRPALFDEL